MTEEELGRGKIEIKYHGLCAYQQLFDGCFYVVFSRVDDDGLEFVVDKQIVSSKPVLDAGLAKADEKLEQEQKEPLKVIDYSFKSERELRPIIEAHKKPVIEEPTIEKNPKPKMGFLK